MFGLEEKFQVSQALFLQRKRGRDNCPRLLRSAPRRRRASRGAAEELREGRGGQDRPSQVLLTQFGGVSRSANEARDDPTLAMGSGPRWAAALFLGFEFVCRPVSRVWGGEGEEEGWVAIQYTWANFGSGIGQLFYSIV